MSYSLREYNDSDSYGIWQLFYDTVHHINAKDYSLEQLNAWASPDTDHIEWSKTRLGQGTIVACMNEKIVSFGKITPSGLFDLLYVHKDFINKGIGTLICDELEKRCQVNEITTYTSITAKSFFEKRGYKMIRENEVIKNGVTLKNYVMIKYI